MDQSVRWCFIIRCNRFIQRALLAVVCLVMYFFVYTQVRSVHDPPAVVTSLRLNGNSTAVHTKRVVVIREQLINQHDYAFNINEPTVCSGDVTLLVVVMSAVKNTQARDVIRKTWGSYANDASSHCRIVFLVGVSSGIHANMELAKESEEHHDIIQENFVDTYRNLTLKSMGMLKWTKEFCNQSKFLLKTDDDMFINIPKLISVLEAQIEQSFLIGNVIVGAKPRRDKESKWFASGDEYSERVYPKYVSGTAYAMTTSIVGDLFEVAVRTKQFWLEDIFITGICAKKIALRHISHPGFTFYKRKFDPCIFQNIISSHRVTPNELINYHEKIKQMKGKCP